MYGRFGGERIRKKESTLSTTSLKKKNKKERKEREVAQSDIFLLYNFIFMSFDF